jgi:DNA-binding IclR family transcriptional regulator
MNPNGRASGLQRGLEILSVFAESQTELGISEIARRMALHKSQVHRAVQTLKDMGFLNQNPETGKYLLGWRAFEIGVTAVRKLGFGPEIQLLLREQAAKVEGTVSIRVLDGETVVVVERVEGS